MANWLWSCFAERIFQRSAVVCCQMATLGNFYSVETCRNGEFYDRSYHHVIVGMKVSQTTTEGAEQLSELPHKWMILIRIGKHVSPEHFRVPEYPG